MFELTILVGHCRLCKEELKQQDGDMNVNKWLEKGFAKWFKTHVRCFTLESDTSILHHYFVS
jgi:hypothetical protein